MSEELNIDTEQDDVEKPEAEPESDEQETDSEPERSGDPAKALRAERGKRKEAAKKVAALEAQVQQLQGMANEYQQILPILPQLIEKAKKADQVIPQQQMQQKNAELVAVANDLGFVNELGEPDVDRAARVLGYLDKRAGSLVNQQLTPVKKQTMQHQVEAVKERAYGAVDNEGRPFAKKAAIDEVFKSMPPEALTDPNTASIALLIARGLMGPGDLPDEPTFVSGGSSMPGGTPRLTDLEKAIAKMRGKSEKDYAKGVEKMAPPSAAGWSVE